MSPTTPPPAPRHPHKPVHEHPEGAGRVLPVAAKQGARHAPVAQGIEQRPPEPCAQVRILPGALRIKTLTSGNAGQGLSCACQNTHGHLAMTTPSGKASTCGFAAPYGWNPKCPIPRNHFARDIRGTEEPHGGAAAEKCTL